MAKAPASKQADPWQAVLERTQAIVSILPPTSQIPHLTKNLPELASAGQRIVVNQEKQLPPASQASSLLAPQSVLFDSSKLDERLSTLAALNTAPAPTYDLHETIIVSVIEAAMAATLAESERYLMQTLEADFEAAKQQFLKGPAQPAVAPQVLTAAVRGNNAALVEASTPYAQRSAPATPAAAVPLARVGPATTPKMNLYAAALEDLIGSAPSLAWSDALARAVATVADEAASKELAQSWSLVGALASAGGVGLSARSRRAKAHLEAQHLHVVASRLGDSSKPVPAAVKAWLQLVQTNHLAGIGRMGPALQVDDERVDGVPVWALAYYCARCGDWAAAADALSRGGGGGGGGGVMARGGEACIVTALRALERGDAVDDDTAKRAQQLRDSRELQSPWKLALVLIASRDTSRSPSVLVSSVEDFVWLKTCASLACDDARERELNLQELGQQVTVLGPEHFRGDVNPLLYFRIVAACGLVEQALDFLAANQSVTDTLADAVHFAIALSATGSLGKGVLAKLVEQYVGRFESSPRAVLYACMAMDHATREFPASIEQAIRRLLSAPAAPTTQLLQTLETLLGRARAERFATAAARETNKPEVAVRLLEWVSDAKPEAFQSLFAVLASALSAAIDTEQPSAPWVREAVRFGPAMQRHPGPSATALQQLLDCAAFLEQPAATASFDRLDWLLPLTVRPAAVGQGPQRDAESLARSFAMLDATASAVFPRVALQAMGGYLVQLRDKKQRGDDQAAVAALRQRASAMVHMCGLLRRNGYSLPANVAQALLHLESESA